MSDGQRPTVSVTDAVLVEIRRSQPDAPQRVYQDDGTVQAFMEWQREAGVYAIGGFACGPGHLVGTFSAKDGPAIRQWFAGRESQVTDG